NQVNAKTAQLNNDLERLIAERKALEAEKGFVENKQVSQPMQPLQYNPNALPNFNGSANMNSNMPNMNTMPLNMPLNLPLNMPSTQPLQLQLPNMLQFQM